MQSKLFGQFEIAEDEEEGQQNPSPPSPAPDAEGESQEVPSRGKSALFGEYEVEGQPEGGNKGVDPATGQPVEDRAGAGSSPDRSGAGSTVTESQPASDRPTPHIDDAIYGRGLGDQAYRDATGQTGYRTVPGKQPPEPEGPRAEPFIDDAIYGRGMADQAYRDATGQTGFRSKPGVEDPRNKEEPQDLPTSNAPFRAQTEPVDGVWDTDLGNMYRGLRYGEALRKYGDMVDDENSSIGLDGRLRYRNPNTDELFVIPPPSRDLNPTELLRTRGEFQGEEREYGLMDRLRRAFTPYAKISAQDSIFVSGAVESTNDLLELGAGVVDLLPGVDISDDVEVMTASADTDSDFGMTLLADATPALAAGVGAASYVAKAAKGLNTFTRALAMGSAGEIAATMTTGTDEEPLFMGLDLGTSDGMETLSHRINVLAEGFLLAGLFGAGVQGAATAISYANDYAISPIVTAARGAKAPMEQKEIRRVLRHVANLGPDASPTDLYNAAQRVAQSIDENKEIVTRSLANLDETRKIRFDTATSIIRGTDDPATRAAAGQLQQGQLVNGKGNTVKAVSGPMNALEEEIEGQARALGGETTEAQTAAMGRSADALLDQSRAAVAQADLDVATARELFERSQDDILAGFEQDLEFGSRLKRLEDLTGTQIRDAQRGKLSNIKGNLRTAYETMRNRKNELYAQVQGGEINVPGLISKLENLPDDAITLTAASVQKNKPVAGLLRGLQYAKSGIEDVNDAGKPILRQPTPEEVEFRFEEFLAANGFDFGRLYREVRPEISQVASDLFGDPKTRGAGRALRDLVNYIDNDMLDYLRRNGDPDTAAAAEAAHQFYRDKFAPVFGSNQGRMREYADLYEGTVGRTNNYDALAEFEDREFAGRGFAEGQSRLIDGTVQGREYEPVESLKRALDTLGTDGQSGDVADYMMLNVIDGFSRRVQEEGVTGVNALDIEERLQPYSDALRLSFPQKADQIDAFIGKIKTAQRQGKDVARLVEITQQRAQQARDEIQNSILSNFVRKNKFGGNEFATTSNPYGAFERIFQSKDASDSVDEIMFRLAEEKSPATQRVIRDGLATAYNRHLQQKLLSNVVTSDGARSLSIARSGAAEREYNELFRIGRKIFSDTPEVMEAMETMIDAVNTVTSIKGAKFDKSASSTAPLQAAQTATNRLIYATVGPLTRVGTRIRSGLGMLVEAAEPDEVARTIADNIMADPDYAAQLMRLYNQEPSDRILEANTLRFLFSGLLKTDYDAEQGGLQDQMLGAFGVQ